MTAIGFFMFFTGVIVANLIGEYPGHKIGVPVLVWISGGLGLLIAGLSIVLWRALP